MKRRKSKTNRMPLFTIKSAAIYCIFLTLHLAELSSKSILVECCCNFGRKTNVTCHCVQQVPMLLQKYTTSTNVVAKRPE